MECTSKCQTVYEMGFTVRYEIDLFIDGIEVGYAHILAHVNKEFIEIAYIEIYKDYRGKGYSKFLHKVISNLYFEEELLRGKIISRKFANPIAEKAAKRAMDNGLYPTYSWDEKYIERSYN